MDLQTQRLMQGAAGATGEKTYVEDVFSVDCWRGDGSTRTINNGIDLAGEGGMVWIRNRSNTDDHQIYDTVRGANQRLKFNSTDGNDARSTALTSFNSNGFSVGEDCNNNGADYVAYTFRRAPGFFDVVGYSGNGSNRTIAHSLEVTPLVTIVKKRDTSGSGAAPWAVDHHKMRSNNGQTILLNTTAPHSGNEGWFKDGGSWNGSQFPLGSNWRTNDSASTFVAYLFAGSTYSWEGKWFGDDEDSFVMKSDSYQGNSSTNGPDVDLGFQPQFLLVRNIDRTQDWFVFDSFRGIGATAQDNGGTATDKFLRPNSTQNESTADRLSLINNGIKPTSTFQGINGSGDDHIYIAIRRPDPKVSIPPTVGTDVFAMDTGNGSSVVPSFDSNFPVDWGVYRQPAASCDWFSFLRINSPRFHKLNVTSAESDTSSGRFDSQVGFMQGSAFDSSYQAWMWRRYKGFDVVNYKGNGTSNTDIAHSLYNTPRMIWVKRRNGGEAWCVYHIGLDVGGSPQNYNIKLNSSDAAYASQLEWGSPNSSTFTVGGGNNTNQNSVPYVALLFGDVEGISKCGYYDGSSSAQTITTGFAPRFLILKNITDSSTGWVVLDTTRGWGSGNDQMLNINSTEAQNNFDNLGAPTSTGFTVSNVNAQWNAANKKYIYYAHS